MPTSLRAASVGGGVSADPVAGRIDTPPNSLMTAMAAWVDHLKAKGRRDRTVAVYKKTVERTCRERGWVDPADLTYAAVMEHLVSAKIAGGWKSGTYNRALAVWRSFTAYLHKSGRIAANPLGLESNAPDDSGDGARAATTQEACRHIAQAWARQQDDRRCRCDRALYWACLYLAGMRSGEPGKLRMEHMDFSGPIACVHWDQGINKNRKRQTLPLHPELAALLARHIQRESSARAAAGRPPLGPKDPIFPVRTTPVVFRRDRDRAGIVARDARGRGFSPHSARKWFETELIRCGVHQRTIDVLMRHATGTQGRYVDLLPEELAQALAKLPCLWPEKNLAQNLTSADQSADTAGAAPMPTTSVIATSSPDQSIAAWLQHIQSVVPGLGSKSLDQKRQSHPQQPAAASGARALDGSAVMDPTSTIARSNTVFSALSIGHPS